MKKILSILALFIVLTLMLTACKSEPDETPAKKDVVTVIDGHLVVNGVITEYKVDTKDVVKVVNGYLVVNGVKTEYKVHTEPVVSVIDGYVAVNGVKTKYEVNKEDVITLEDGYLVVNGVKTEYCVEPTCNHDWQTVTTPPTCTEEGYDVMTCIVCDKTIRTNIVSATSHSYANYSTDDEYHWRVCSACSEIADKEYHTLDDEGVCTVCQLPLSATPGVVYDVSADGTYAEVIGYNGTATKVKIAEEYNGLPVKSIYDRAFYENQTITSIVIPDSVTSIGSYAFQYCYSLTSVVIPDSVTSIGEWAFFECGSLTSVVIGDSVTSIGGYAFQCCYSLTSVVIGDSVTSIGRDAFAGCHSSLYTEYEYGRYIGSGDNPYLLLIDVTNNNMRTYTIHEDTRVIGAVAFSDCSRLASITIPDSVTSIGDEAFWYCTSLTSVAIPDSVTSIGKWAFDGCSALTDVYYTGSEAQWALINIDDSSNYYLTRATKHYNYVPDNN